MALGTPVAAAAAYSAAAGATSVAPAYPAGIVATDVLILVVGQKPTAANGGTVTTPTGWTLRDELTAAGGYGTTIGADTGNTNLRVYTKNTVAGTETGTLAVTLAGSDIAWAFIVRVPSNGGTLSYGSADGQRTTAPTANTPFAVALTNSASATAFANGDVAIWAMCIPTDVTTPTQFSAQSITATGATFGAATELNEPDNSTGNDIGGYSAWARVTAGSSAVAPTVTVTAGGTVTNVRGPIVLLRVRETLPTSTGTFSATESGPDGFDARLQAPKLGAVAYSVATPTTIAVPYPSGIAANDALVLFVAVKGSTEGIGSIQAAPSGWTEQCLLYGQGGYPSNIASLDAGNVQLAVYTKNDVSGSESGSVNFALNDSNIAWAIIARYPSAPQRKPDFFAFATGQTSFITGDTNVPRGTNLGPIFGNGRRALAADDVILFAGAIPTSAYAPNLFSGHSFDPGLVTFGPTKQIAEYATNTATHIGGFFAWADVRTSDYALDDINLYSLVYIGEYAFSVGGALTALRIRQKPFFQGSLNASETGSDTFAGRPPRPDLGTRTGALAATESPDRLTDGFGDSTYGYSTPPPTIGAVAYSTTTTISPAYPAGIAANSIIVMFVAQKPSTANGGTITTPAGWTLQGQSLAGGGYGTTLGIDTGNQNIWVFTKTTVTGTETGTVAVTLATTNSAWAAITSVQRSNSHPLSFLSFAGESITPSTFFSSVNYPIVPNPGDRTDVNINDIILFGASLASDNGTPTNFSELAINDNFGVSRYTGLAELAEPDSAGGSDIGGLVAWGKCVSSSGALNSYFEISGLVVDTTNSAGPTVALRIRVEYPPVTGNLAATEATDSLLGSGSATASATNLTATRYDNAQVFYSPTVTRGAVTLTPARYDSSQTFFAATVTPGAASLTAARYDNAPIFYTVTVAQGAVTLTPARYDNTQAIYAATVTVGPAVLTAARYDNAQIFYAPTVGRGAVTLTPGRYDNSQAIYAPSVANGAVTLTPARYDNAQSFYAASVTVGAANLTPARYDSAQAFYAPTVTAGAVVLAPARYDNSQTYYAAAVSQASGPQSLTPPRLDNVNAFYGAALLVSGNQALAPPLLQNTQTFFAAALSLATDNPSGNVGSQVVPKPRKARPAWVLPPPMALENYDEEEEALLLVGAL